ncbi:hypothetical protein OF83DRAFT_1144335 [Amylostereum chailletii]|nr:hypothetical protein OF83DRAFT_1144335 [Amylostereum chailletii]
MPAATITTAAAAHAMSVPPKTPASKSTSTTLRTLYTRAAHAFLHRDISLTHTLISSAFTLLPPPDIAQDSLNKYRRKWDILRITLETTVYTAPPEDAASIPAPLRSNAMLSSASLITSLHARSVQLFTPSSKPDAAFLPAVVLVTLATASVRVNSASVGRSLVEEWLARRGQREDEDGYEKVLEVYCLSVLPALDEWDYAREFLGYETELKATRKERLVSTLSSLYSQHQASVAAEHAASMASSSKSTLDTPHSAPPSSQPTPTPSRPSSPSSSTSSASTTSTHTAVPATPKPRIPAYANGVAPLAPLTKAPSELSSTATSRTATPLPGSRRPMERYRTASHATTSSSSSHSPHVASTTASETPVSAIAVVRAFVRPYLQQGFSLSRLVVFLISLLLPALSLLIRLRRRRVGIPGAPAGSAAAEDVRRRLGVRKSAGLWRTLWEEVVRAVGDTVRMGGRGLV